MKKNYPLLMGSVLTIIFLHSRDAHSLQIKTENQELTMSRTTQPQALNNYETLFNFDDKDQFPVRTLKTYCKYLVSDRNAIHQEVTLRDHSLPSNIVDNFNRNHRRAEESIKEVKEAKLVNNIAEYEVAIGQLLKEFKALEARYDNIIAMERTIRLLDQIVTDLPDNGRLESAKKTLAAAKADFPDVDFKKYDTKIAEYEKKERNQKP